MHPYRILEQRDEERGPKWATRFKRWFVKYYRPRARCIRCERIRRYDKYFVVCKTVVCFECAFSTDLADVDI